MLECLQDIHIGVFGKSYEKSKTLYSLNLTGLPYEMVINSDPCLAYLMKDNTLLLQILTMAHVYGIMTSSEITDYLKRELMLNIL